MSSHRQQPARARRRRRPEPDAAIPVAGVRLCNLPEIQNLAAERETYQRMIAEIRRRGHVVLETGTSFLPLKAPAIIHLEKDTLAAIAKIMLPRLSKRLHDMESKLQQLGVDLSEPWRVEKLSGGVTRFWLDGFQPTQRKVSPPPRRPTSGKRRGGRGGDKQ